MRVWQPLTKLNNRQITALRHKASYHHEPQLSQHLELLPSTIFLL